MGSRAATATGFVVGDVFFEVNRRSKRTLMRARGFLLLVYAGIGAECIVQAFRNTSTVHTVFSVLGALVCVQVIALSRRSRFLIGPTYSDRDMQERVAPIVTELCAKADQPLPHVAIRDGAYLAAVVPAKSDALLIVNRDALRTLNDEQLRCVIAHEVAHLRAGDLARARSLGKKFRLLCILWLVALEVLIFDHEVNLVPLLLAFQMPFFRFLSLYIGRSKRASELLADSGAVELTSDPATVVTALTALHGVTEDYRRRILGPPQWSWLFFPFSLRPTTHPTLAQRISNVEVSATAPTQ
jgi:Zn-dependent protease with chaperone function